MTIYLDCNATTPIEPEVADVVLKYMTTEYGNAASRTHEYGLRAKKAVTEARKTIASSLDVDAGEVIFTSGATESNNLSIFGLVEYGEANHKKHIVSTMIEHKSILEPLLELEKRGFEITLLKPNNGGWIEPEAVKDAIRDDTLLLSVMQVNNETGVIQPIEKIADMISDTDVFFHVDAAQGYGKATGNLKHKRIDLVSLSSHKLYGPKGIGALVAKRRGYKRIPIKPLIYGGGQEHGLRAGTLAVPLIAGFGKAVELACRDEKKRLQVCNQLKEKAVEALNMLNPTYHGDQDKSLPHVINFSVPGLDSEAAVLALKGVAAIANGSACNSRSYSHSHVLSAMGLCEEELEGAIRLSWCHMTGEVPWSEICTALNGVR